jgi:hypothetical protein
MNRLHVVVAVLCCCGLPRCAEAQRPPATGGVQIAELSPQAERAIDKGLRYLAESQADDGGWGRTHRVAHTALALMAFMVKGHMPERSPYGGVTSQGVDFLLKASRYGDGYMGDSMYDHGLATLSLSEVWGMSTRSDHIRDALKRAVDVILRSQNLQGGWRYQPRPESADISITVMQIVALASASEAGIVVPDSTIRRAVAYVKSLQNSSGGFGYQSPHNPGFARTAAGVASLMMCGQRDSDAVRRGLDYLLKNSKDGKWFYYGHYYAVLAMYQGGDRYYRQWYPKVREEVLARQRDDGAWGDDYTTPMAILVLGVPYRFLPIYQR